MNIIVVVGNTHVELGTDDGYAPDVADDLHRHAVSTMQDLLAVAMAAGAYRADRAADGVEDDSDG